MLASLALTTALLQRSFPGIGQDGHAHYQVEVGWHDELDSRCNWGPLAMENQPKVIAPPGTLLMCLGQVPPNWPYEYQWSGVTQDANVNLAAYPVLIAKLTYVFGYAHMDIDILDAQGKVTQTLRTTTLNNPGLSTLDFSPSVRDSHRLRLRLIVGGQNEGCAAIYDWVRFVSKKDADFLANHPDWPYVRLPGGMER